MELIVFDLDNTLLRSDKTISEYSLATIKKLKDKGAIIAFATARGEGAARRIIDLVKPDAVISNGGSLVRYDGEVIHKCTLSKETSNKILEQCLLSKSVGLITLETSSGYYVNWEHPFTPDYAHAIKSDFTRPLTEDTYKMTIEFSDSQAAKEIAAKFPDCSLISHTGEDWHRFANKESNKLNGIKALIEELNISLKQVTAFGDDENDIEMVRECGVGVAMGNAIEEVKAVSDYICGTNDEDGAARWLESFN